jgi:hypothetical protein
MVMEYLFRIFVPIAVAPALIAWNGYVISILWNWYFVPLGVKPLNWAAGYGISAVICVMTYRVHPTTNHEEETAPVLTMILASLIHPLIVLFFGWLLKSYASYGS